MMTKILACPLIPVYTILFTRGYSWLTTNFSVIGNLIGRKLASLPWDMMVGVYHYMIYRAIRERIRLEPLATRLSPIALLLLFCAVTTPCLPEQLPLKSSLHTILAFASMVLLPIFLALVSWSQYPSAPGVYRPSLPDLAVIVVVLTVPLAVAGIVNNALEILLTVTAVILSSRLMDCLRKLGGPGANSTRIMK